MSFVYGASSSSPSAAAFNSGSSARNCSSASFELRTGGEEVVEPLPWRMQLEAVARPGRHEGPPAAVLLHAQLTQLGARKRRDEIVLVEREAEVIDSRQLPLARLHDDVHRAALQLGQA